jgi:hypothetical protein
MKDHGLFELPPDLQRLVHRIDPEPIRCPLVPLDLVAEIDRRFPAEMAKTEADIHRIAGRREVVEFMLNAAARQHNIKWETKRVPQRCNDPTSPGPDPGSGPARSP